jgi:hypothetical protein
VSSGIFSGEIRRLVVKLWLTDCCDSFFSTKNGQVANLPEKDSKAKKCEFRKLKIEYLGPVIEEGKLAIDPAKLKGILD